MSNGSNKNNHPGRRTRPKKAEESPAAATVESQIVQHTEGEGGTDGPADRLEDLSARDPADATIPVEGTRGVFSTEETEMNDHVSDEKRDAGSPEDQSKQAAHEAKLALLHAQKAKDAAAIATAELTKRTAISVHANAVLDAEHVKEQSHAEKRRFVQQLESASTVSRHLHNLVNDANLQAQNATDHYHKLKITLDQAEADMNAAVALAKLKSDEYAEALKAENDLRAQVTLLDTANETFEMSKAAAEVALATAKAAYAQEIARIKKDAADRDMP